MIIANDIRRKIDETPVGVVLTPADFNVPTELQPALIMALNRMVAAGELQRLSKGKYFKPRNTIFGQLPPNIEEVVKDLLVKNGTTIGYISGTNAFARLGLTTQISSHILIGTNKYRHPLMRGNIKISFLLQPNPIKDDDVELFIILDALRLIREIPATTPNEGIEIVIATIKTLPKRKQERLAVLALSYTPYVRALLGAIYEYLGLTSDELHKSLNGTTNYRLGISEDILPTKTNWRII